MFLGIDIGGTNIKLGVIDKNYQILEKYSIAAEKDNGDIHFVQTIAQKAKEIKQKFNFERIGIGTPGTLDAKSGVVVRSANLPYKNTPVVEIIQQELEVPVKIANDAACAICGELYAGIGKRYDNFLMLTLGTGVGGGIVLNGKPYFGSRGRAGEFGHFVISYGGRECGCGQKGCFEQYASVNALIRITEEAAVKKPHSILAEMCNDEVSGKTVFEAKKAGCSVADEVIKQYIDYLRAGMVSLYRFFQPQAIVIGGGISNEEEYLIEPLKACISFPMEIFASSLKNDAGILGAVAIATESVKI